MFPTAAAVAFTALATIWRHDDWLNTFLKIAFIAMAVWAGIEALLAWGFVLAPQSN